MKNLLILIPFVALLLGGGCTEKPHEMITVDPSANYPKKEYVVQDILQVEYVPLQTDDQFVTQGRVFAIGKEYIVTGNWTNDGNIYLFDRRNGAAVRVLNRKGQGAEEYSYVSGVLLDEHAGELFVNDATTKRIRVYDLEGNFKRKLDQVSGTQCMEVYSFDEKNLICYDMSVYYEEGKPHSKPAYYYIVSKQDGSVTREIPIPFEIVRSPVVQEGDFVTMAQVRALTPSGNDWILSETSSDTLYQYVSDQALLRPFLVNACSGDILHFLAVGVVTDQYCFMQATEKRFDFTKGKGFFTKHLVYEFADQQVYEANVYNGDFKEKRGVDLTANPLNQPSCMAYETITADKLVEAYQEHKLQGQLEEIASKLDEEDNPVIMLVKRK